MNPPDTESSITTALPVTEPVSPPSLPPPLPPAMKSAGPDFSLVIILLPVVLIAAIILHRSQIRYSPNDASRLDTVYYLVEHGTYEFVQPRIDVKWANRVPDDYQVPWADQDDPHVWNVPVLTTIDMISIDGKLYSSKPPLLPTMLAGIAWAAERVSGQTFHENPWVIVRTLLIVAQLLPFAVFLLLLRSDLRRATTSPFVFHFCLAVAAFATYLTPWLIAINNHVVAACTGYIALHAAMRIWYDHRRAWYWFALAGFFAALTAAIELPAGLLAVALFVGLLIKDAKRTLTVGLIAAAIPAVAGLYTNYVVTGQLKPAYEQVDDPHGPYHYPGSYWNKPDGIDANAEPKGVYLFHMLLGHDGFFSLTPVLAVALGGLLVYLVDRRSERWMLAALTLGITAAVVAVYTVKTNNYGGGCNGFRWLFWLVPMWLLCLPPAVQWLSARWPGRAVLYLALAVSLFSTGFALDNPWMSTWIRVILSELGKINY